jgi:adenosylhomocysteine nucleosidase
MKKVVIVASEYELPPTKWKFDIPLVYSGIGKINAAYNTYYAISKFAPDLVINLGSVGSLVMPIGTTLEIASVVERDFDAEPLESRGTVPFDTCPSVLNSIAEGYKCGTGDNFVMEKDPWLASNDIDVVDMELFSIAKICYLSEIKWRSGKYISDQIGSNSPVEWKSQINVCGNNLIEWFEENCLN